jgi:hypothetical protein
MGELLGFPSNSTFDMQYQTTGKYSMLGGGRWRGVDDMLQQEFACVEFDMKKLLHRLSVTSFLQSTNKQCATEPDAYLRTLVLMRRCWKADEGTVY